MMRSSTCALSDAACSCPVNALRTRAVLFDWSEELLKILSYLDLPKLGNRPQPRLLALHQEPLSGGARALDLDVLLAQR